MTKLRNSVKAIIIRDGKILFNKMISKRIGEVFYILPGGGQYPEETFVETLKRECIEELGAEVEIDDLVLVREYIGKNHEFAHHDSEVHQIEYMFKCKLRSEIDMDKVVQFDQEQTGHQWIALDELKSWDVYPKVLKDIIGKEGIVSKQVYLGDIN